MPPRPVQLLLLLGVAVRLAVCEERDEMPSAIRDGKGRPQGVVYFQESKPRDDLTVLYAITSASQGLLTSALNAGFMAFDIAGPPEAFEAVGAELGDLNPEVLYLQVKFVPPNVTTAEGGKKALESGLNALVNGLDSRGEPQSATQFRIEEATVAFHLNLRSLHTPYVNCLLLSNPMPSYDDNMRAWRAMEAAHGAGLTRRLGLSNWHDLTSLQRLMNEVQVKPSVIQNRFSRASGWDLKLRRFLAKEV